MLSNLFKKNGQNGAAIPSGHRVYAIGDIHGSLDALNNLLDRIAEDQAGVGDPDLVFSENGAPRPDKSTLIFLGDYIDRGPESRGVIERLISLRRVHEDMICLKGNHEAAILDFLAAPNKWGEWLHWGGAETLESYGLQNVWNREEGDLAAELKEQMPQSHRDFLETLELSRTVGDYLFVHAGLKPGIALEDQQAKDLLWIRGEFHRTPKNQRPDQVVVHGHHPVKKPQDTGWRINVDTGACWTGMLTAVVLEGSNRRYISTT